MKLSKRQIELLLRLIESQESLTAQELATVFQVSVRTIKYDLDDIRLWGKEKNIELQAQRNKGFWLELTKAQRHALKTELLEVEQFDVYYNQESRISYLMMLFLMTNELTTMSDLARELEVSINTIVSDLLQVDEVLEAFDVTLVRQSGQGLLLVGDEEKLRSLMEYCLYEELTEYDIYKIMNQLLEIQEKKEYQESMISISKYQEFYRIYKQVLQLMAENVNPIINEEFNYAELLSFSFRLAISVFRLKINCSLSSLQLLTNLDERIKKREIPFLLIQRAFESSELPLLQKEYDYISSKLGQGILQEDILQLTIRMIQGVSESFALPFEKDPQLLTNLFAHLSLRLGKKHLFMNEYNPFVEEILTNHQSLFKSIRQVATKELKTLPFLLTDSFISYLTLHFLVSIERQKKESVRVIYVCSTGLGVTKLLQQKVEEEVQNVEIVKFASVLNAMELIEKEQPDLVISIFPIDGVDCPVLKVHPIPTKEDITLIKQTVDGLLVSGATAQHRPRKLQMKQILDETMEDFSRELIVTSFTVYERLVRIFGDRLNQEYKDAFLLHVFLMVHRITFDTQYQLEGNVDSQILIGNEERLLEVEQLFSENDLSVNKAELTALFQYLVNEVTL